MMLTNPAGGDPAFRPAAAIVANAAPVQEDGQVGGRVMLLKPVTGAVRMDGRVVRQECTAIVVTHPGAANHLRSVMAAIREWGIDYVKADFLYVGCLRGAAARRRQRGRAYRRGLRLIRDAIGPEATLLGCGAPALPSVGLTDAMRVGPDIAGGGLSRPSQRNAARNVAARAWQHGRFWSHDADCLLARPGVQCRESWAETVRRFGGLRSSGDGLAELDAWGLETTRQLMVPSAAEPLV
jgi:alpha-galactosidase